MKIFSNRNDSTPTVCMGKDLLGSSGLVTAMNNRIGNC